MNSKFRKQGLGSSAVDSQAPFYWEQEVCGLLAFGHTNGEIAEKLNISERTVETHRVNILSKLGLKSRAELVRFAIDNGLVKFT